MFRVRTGEHDGRFKLSSQHGSHLETFGRIFGVSRQALVNDDLGGFLDLATRFGRAAAEFEAEQLTSLLWGAGGMGPIMSDSVACFDAAHANTTTGAMSVAAVGAARKKMRLQLGLSGTPISVVPRYLIVSASLETDAEQLLTAIAAAKVGDANVFAGRLELIVEPRLDGRSVTVWYLASDTASCDHIEHANLEGEPAPRIDVREGFDIDGIETRVRLDWGGGILDWRGLVRSTGV